MKSIASKKQKGFTLIEILIIVAIITILVTVVLVSLMNSKKKAQDNSAFTSFKTLAAPAFACLNSGLPGITLTAPTPNTNICSIPAVTSGSTWPDFSKYGWGNFRWCRIDTPIEIIPAVGAYDNALYGGNNATGTFCFMLEKDGKIMWCTVEGCRKNGF